MPLFFLERFLGLWEILRISIRGPAQSPNRAQRAFWISFAANLASEIHEPLRIVRNQVASGHQRLRALPDLFFKGLLTYPTGNHPNPCTDSLDVAVNHREPRLMTRKGRYGRCR